MKRISLNLQTGKCMERKNGRVDGDEWGVVALEVEGDMVSNLLLPVSLCI